jgi:hypothetical protein
MRTSSHKNGGETLLNIYKINLKSIDVYSKDAYNGIIDTK